jgi:hypothetical protein
MCNTKTCARCGETKNIEEFAFRIKAKNIRQSYCGDCFKIIRRESYEKNKQTSRDKNKRLRERNLKWYREFKKTLKCNRCPEDHPATLDFHHKDSDEKEFIVSHMIRDCYSIERIKREIDKCEVLCSNCHRKHHHEEKLSDPRGTRTPIAGSVDQSFIH